MQLKHLLVVLVMVAASQAETNIILYVNYTLILKRKE